MRLLLLSLGWCLTPLLLGIAPRSIRWQVPLIPQTTNYSCGVATLRAVLAYYGVFVSDRELFRALRPTYKMGTDHRRMVAYARRMGVDAEVRSNLTLNHLIRCLECEQLAIVEAQAWLPGATLADYRKEWECGHYLIVIGADKDNLYFADPLMKKQRGYLPRSEFLVRWHDLGWSNEQLFRTAILFDGEPSLEVVGRPARSPSAWRKVP